MPKKIKNLRYRQFLDNGIISYVTLKEIKEAIDTISPKYKKAGTSLLIAMYYTGARPTEILRLTGKDIEQEGNYITIQLQGSKRGLPRKLFFSKTKSPLIEELYKYAKSMPERVFLFWQFKNKYERTKKGKKGNIITVFETTDKLRYHFKKWFETPVNPYFLRHNRFSQLSEAGLTMQDLRMIKGSRSYESLNYYIHLSSLSAKKAAAKVR